MMPSRSGLNVTKPQRLAARVLQVRPTLPASRRAMTAAGLRQARLIAAGKPVRVGYTYSFLSRAQPAAVNAKLKGKDYRTSKAIQAYDGGVSIYDKKLFVRHGEVLFIYDIEKK